jgi:hypothetical protein
MVVPILIWLAVLVALLRVSFNIRAIVRQPAKLVAAMKQLAYRWWCTPGVKPSVYPPFAKSGALRAFWHSIGTAVRD